jgi:hypothetical protein
MLGGFFRVLPAATVLLRSLLLVRTTLVRSPQSDGAACQVPRRLSLALHVPGVRCGHRRQHDQRACTRFQPRHRFHTPSRKINRPSDGNTRLSRLEEDAARREGRANCEDQCEARVPEPQLSLNSCRLVVFIIDPRIYKYDDRLSVAQRILSETLRQLLVSEDAQTRFANRPGRFFHAQRRAKRHRDVRDVKLVGIAPGLERPAEKQNRHARVV